MCVCMFGVAAAVAAVVMVMVMVIVMVMMVVGVWEGGCVDLRPSVFFRHVAVI